MEEKKEKSTQGKLANKTKLLIGLCGGLFLALAGLILLWGVIGTDYWKTILGVVLAVGGIVLAMYSIKYIDNIIKMKDMSKNTQTLYMVAHIVFYLGIVLIGFFFAADAKNILQLILGVVLFLGGAAGVFFIQKHLIDKKNGKVRIKKVKPAKAPKPEKKEEPKKDAEKK